MIFTWHFIHFNVSLIYYPLELEPIKYATDNVSSYVYALHLF